MAATIRVVTRGSALALTQTKQLVETLKERNPACAFEIVTLTTTGDRVTDQPLSQFRGMGVFVKELQKALLNNEADLAVHSLKDIPVEQVEELTLAAFPLRITPYDLLLSKNGARFNDLPQAAVIGTSSPRRMVQLKAVRPDLVFKDLRGNVDTRLRKLHEGQYDAIIAAAAGMTRLGLTFPENSIMPLELCLPAAGQGCLAIECKESAAKTKQIAARVDDSTTRREVCAERDFLRVIGGGCQTPIAVYAKVNQGPLTITAAIGDPQSGRLVRESLTVGMDQSQTVGNVLAKKMIALCKEHEIRIE
ncbi:MAG: hydroxymethylbilane synthase [Chitinivibrionales bacterium]|nr:hydroxymethylbilane synthase [Chitinivibrionales bacterium]